jgi:hypothetical protein
MEASMSRSVVPHVLVRNGQLLTGRLDKHGLAKLLRTVCLTTKHGATFMSNMTRLTSLFINSRPASMGPSDMRAADKVHHRVKYLVGFATDLVSKYAPRLSNDDLHSALGLVYNVAESAMRFAVETREAERDMLQVFTDDAGCKGTFHNKVQVQASHGVALMKGELILNTDPSSTRVLPCFPPNTSRSDLCQFGVIRESLSQGVPAKAAMFTFCQGRVGLVDTAITTSKSGYTGNKIGVNMSCRIIYGNLVLSNHVVVMNIYYGDGYDPVRTIEKKAPFLLWSPTKLKDSVQDSVLPSSLRDLFVQLACQVSETKLRAFEFSDILDLPYDLETIFLKTYYSSRFAGNLNAPPPNTTTFQTTTIEPNNTSTFATPNMATFQTSTFATPNMAPPNMAPPNMATFATPNMAPPNMATPNMATLDMAPPNMATPNMATLDMAPPNMATNFARTNVASTAKSSMKQPNPSSSWSKFTKLFESFAKWTSSEAVKPVMMHDLIVLSKLLGDPRYFVAFCDAEFAGKLFDLMESLFAQALYSPGTQCGRIASMGMSSKIMQVVLNSHRTSGATNAGGGLVRFDSILSVAPAHPSVASMCVECDSEVEARLLALRLPLTVLQDVIVSTSYEASSANLVQDSDILGISDGILTLRQTKLAFLSTSKTLLGFVWRFVVSKQACLERNIKLGQIASALQTKLDGLLASSNASKSHVARSRSDSPTWVLRVLLAHNAETNLLKAKKKLSTLFASDLCGVKCGGLQRVFGAHPVCRTTFVRAQDGSIAQKDSWFVCTSGTNLRAAMRVVDPLKVTSNCIRDTEQALGVFAAQRVFFTELKTVMGSNVQDRHVFLLSQTILMSGRLCGVNRHGFARSGQPIAQICFENARKAVVDLAHNAARDDCQDDTAAAVLGRTSRAGTGSVVLLAPNTSTTKLSKPLKRRFAMISCKSGSFFDQVKRMRSLAKISCRNQQQHTTAPTIDAGFLLNDDTFISPTPTSPTTHQPTSATYRVKSPSARSNSPNYCVNSPTHSSPTHQPTSPNYRVESPSTRSNPPNNCANSPSYQPKPPNDCANSPSYQPKPPNDCANSPSYQPKPPNDCANSPSYQPKSPHYPPKSPNDGANSPSYQPKSPNYFVGSPKCSTESPSYQPKSPNYFVGSPKCSTESPSYQPKSPNYFVESPNYSTESPSYHPKSPNYFVESPNYSTESPTYHGSSNYRTERTTYHGKSPKRRADRSYHQRNEDQSYHQRNEDRSYHHRYEDRPSSKDKLVDEAQACATNKESKWTPSFECTTDMLLDKYANDVLSITQTVSGQVPKVVVDAYIPQEQVDAPSVNWDW